MRVMFDLNQEESILKDDEDLKNEFLKNGLMKMIISRQSMMLLINENGKNVAQAKKFGRLVHASNFLTEEFNKAIVEMDEEDLEFITKAYPEFVRSLKEEKENMFADYSSDLFECIPVFNYNIINSILPITGKNNRLDGFSNLYLRKKRIIIKRKRKEIIMRLRSRDIEEQQNKCQEKECREMADVADDIMAKFGC